MWKVNNNQKYNIPFPSMIIRLASALGVERRLGDRMSALISTHPYLPFGEYEERASKKKKTSEPPPSSSAPPTPSAPALTVRPLYKLVQDLLQELHRHECRCERRYQWLADRQEGRDPGPPPVATPEPEPEPETEPAAAEAAEEEIVELAV
ncbi:uncharacterized protein DS421_19g664290 [Arachis hypogaea]|uniref:Uncharacterized protein n=2 Tax=Arachis hypogaea TaxID=3818 RepID=A0A6B9VBJ6_ARAHY|nr:uncharacterized protein DS421_19g664290 [Arachis hypogaea]